MPPTVPDYQKAIDRGDRDKAEQLIDRGLPVSSVVDDDGNQLLHKAVMERDERMIRVLVYAGANPYAVNNNGESAVSLAANYDSYSVYGRWAASYIRESRFIASKLLRVIESGKLNAQEFAKQLNPPTFELNITGVGPLEGTLALALIMSERYEHAEILLANGAEVGRSNRSAEPLRIAVENSNQQLLDYLLEKGWYLSAKDTDGLTALAHAIKQANVDMINYLIGKGADVNQPLTKIRATALHLVSTMYASDEHLEQHGASVFDRIATVLIDAGARVDARTTAGETPLFLAAAFGAEGAAQILLKNGAAVAIPNHKGITPMMAASSNGQHALVSLLEDAGASLDQSDESGLTALHQAARTGKLDSVKTLLSNGASGTLRTHSGNTPLCVAIQSQTIEVAAYLAKAVPESVPIACESDWTPLHWVFNGNSDHTLDTNDRKRLAKILVQNGAELEARNDDHLTPLYIAAINSMANGVKTLIDLGADVNFADPSDGITVLMQSARSVDQESLELLLQVGANPKLQDDEGRTALHHLSTRNREVTHNRYAKMARKLIGWGALVNETNDRLETPLMIAAKSGNESIVKVLMTSNANPYLRNYKGETAEYLAYREDHYKVIKLIRQLSSLYEG